MTLKNMLVAFVSSKVDRSEFNVSSCPFPRMHRLEARLIGREE